MNDQEDVLKKALAENAQFKTEKAATIRKESLADFRNKLTLAERIIWVYLLACVVVAVPVLNLFLETYDTKTLISCALLLLVVYETTVLLKLWYAVAGTKLSVLKEVKQLRLEVSELASAAGVAAPADVLSAKYEPMRGTSKLERRVWICVLALAGLLVGSWSSGEGLFTAKNVLSDDTLVTLAPDGSATSMAKVTRTFSGKPGTSFQFFAANSWTIRWIDSQGHELPFDTLPQDTHVRYDVSMPEDASVDGRIVYTRIAEIPEAATLTDGVWRLENDISYGFSQNNFTLTVQLPAGAELLSEEPEPVLELETEGRQTIRFQATRGKNEKFLYNLQYRLPDSAAAGSDQEQ